MSKIKVAFLGVGDVAQRDYLPELHRLGDRVELVALCGQTEERVRVVAQHYGVTVWYTDYHRMLRETDADAVVNLTPIQIHTETTLAALEAGKHVYTEKPVATDVREAQLIQMEARRQDLVLVCAPCVMLFPQIQLARQLLAEGAIGEVYSARGHGHGGVPPWHGYGSDPGQFFVEGGGPARDMGVYPLHALTGLLGPAQRVSAMSARAQQSFTVPDGPAQGKQVRIEVDDNWHMVLDLGERRLASIAANNCVQSTRSPQLELFGLGGTLAIDVLDVSAPLELQRAGSGWEQIPVPRAGRAAGPDHHLGVENLVHCIEQRTTPVLSVEHAIHVVEIIEQAARSSVEGRVFDITNTFEPAQS